MKIMKIEKISRRFFALFMAIVFTIAGIPVANIVKAAECDTGENGDICDLSTSVICSECGGDMLPKYNADGSQTCAECGEVMYSVVSPVGYSNVEMITQAKRLDNLSGKTFALVGGSFNASVTHAELKKCILEEYPDAKVYVLSEIGAGGAFSLVKQSEESKLFQKKLKELGVDAVISGNCGCGLCTVKEAGSSIAAEYVGIPTVTVGAPTFIATIHSTGVNRGVPVLRTAQYPGAFSSDTKEELKKNAREVLWPQIKEQLTTKITEEEISEYANEKGKDYDSVVYTGTYDKVQELYKDNTWTDGLPIVPPTTARVEEYLKYTPYDAGEILGSYAPAYRETTAYTVAVNAVMSGCPPEYMPFCIAFTQCMEDGDWRKTLSSTHGWTPYAWINGPIARQLGIDCGQGMISEENNKALGRFIDLALKNIAGYYVKENSMTTFGNLTPWVFSEDEKACVEVGWKPYHVTQGMDLNSNALTAASALEWGNAITPATTDAEQIMNLVAWDITQKQQNGLGTTSPQVYRTLFVTSNVAGNLATKYSSKEDFEDALVATARRPLWERVYAYYWGNTGSQVSTKKTIEKQYEELLADPDEKAELTEVPDWLKKLYPDTDKIMTVATMLKGDTPILVTGDSSRNKTEVLPGGAYTTVEIELPDNWDSLMENLGYEPLESFYINAEGMESKPAVSNKVKIPSELTDGEYNITGVVTERELTSKGKVLYVSATGKFLYWAYGASEQAYVMLDAKEKDKEFVTLLTSLGMGSSFTVKNGKITSIVLRPSSSKSSLDKDASALTAETFEDIDLTVAANTKKNSSGGAESVDGSTITMSSSVLTYKINLDGEIVFDTTNTPDFIALDGDLLTINDKAKVGSVAKLGVCVDEEKDTYRTFTITKGRNNKTTIIYKTTDSICKMTANVEVNGGTEEVSTLAGNKISISAQALNGSGNYSYTFIAVNQSTKGEIVIASDMRNNSYIWNASNAGSYRMYVDVTDITNNVTIRSNGILVTLLMSENLKAGLLVNGGETSSTVSQGDSISLTGTVSGENGTVTYCFMSYHAVEEKWIIIKEYSTSNSFVITADETGNYKYKVVVKDRTGAQAESPEIPVVVETKKVEDTQGNTGSNNNDNNGNGQNTGNNGNGQNTDNNGNEQNTDNNGNGQNTDNNGNGQNTGNNENGQNTSNNGNGQNAVYRLTLDSNGGTVGKLGIIKLAVVYGEAYGKLLTPERAGYIFNGWYTEKTGGSKVTEKELYQSNTEQTLFAQWKKASVSKVNVTSSNRKKKKAVLKWKSVSGVKGYEIVYATKKNFAGSKKKTITTNKITLTGLNKNKVYYIKVRGYKKDSTGKNIYGKFSKVVKLKKVKK